MLLVDGVLHNEQHCPQINHDMEVWKDLTRSLEKVHKL